MKNGKQLSFLSRVWHVILTLTLTFGTFANIQTATAQPAVVQGARSVIDAVRPQNVAKGLSSLGERGIPEIEVYSAPPRGDLNSIYPVGVQDISWLSREGVAVSALVFYPKTRPVAGSKFSAVIFSHGLGSSAENFSYLGRSWAGRGIVSIFLRHPESDESIWRGKIRAMGELKEAYSKYWTGVDRVRALRSGIDYLYEHHNDPGPLGSDVDLNRIGVAGNDLGALAALLLAGQIPLDGARTYKDPRVSGVLALSPPVFCEPERGPIVYENISAPTMIVTGTEDNGIVGTTKAHERRIPYDSIRGVDKYLVVLQGADHRVYGGRRMGAKHASDQPFQQTIRQETSDFWSAYLQTETSILRQLCAQGKTVPFSNARVEWLLGGGRLAAF
ncbi:MAG: alpha/beta hydrolase family protein [Thermoguttaceae bacterium]